MTKDKLVKHYENKLKKVKDFYSNNTTIKEVGSEEYIKFAENALEAVKNGRGW